MTLSDRLKARMAQMKLSQVEVARRVGVAQPTIAKLVAGTSRSSTYLHRIARALETTPAYLAGETDDPALDARLLPTQENILDEYGWLMIPIGANPKDGGQARPRHLPHRRDLLEPRMVGALEDLTAIEIVGDAMAPTFVAGDLVVIDGARRQVEAQDALWSVRLGGIETVRRVRVLPDGGFSVMADNPVVLPTAATAVDLDVLGAVIWRSGPA